jgi:DhnA family fructose-bisphosphate aldolase class Ia
MFVHRCETLLRSRREALEELGAVDVAATLTLGLGAERIELEAEMLGSVRQRADRQQQPELARYAARRQRRRQRHAGVHDHGRHAARLGGRGDG